MLISIVLYVLFYCLRYCSAVILWAECSHSYCSWVAAIERPPSCLFKLDLNEIIGGGRNTYSLILPLRAVRGLATGFLRIEDHQRSLIDCPPLVPLPFH